MRKLFCILLSLLLCFPLSLIVSAQGETSGGSASSGSMSSLFLLWKQIPPQALLVSLIIFLTTEPVI